MLTRWSPERWGSPEGGGVWSEEPLDHLHERLFDVVNLQADVAPQDFPHVHVAHCHQLRQAPFALVRREICELGLERAQDPLFVHLFAVVDGAHDRVAALAAAHHADHRVPVGQHAHDHVPVALVVAHEVGDRTGDVADRGLVAFLDHERGAAPDDRVQQALLGAEMA